jgi:hypothetical protein
VLTSYQQQTQRLLNDDSAHFFNIDDLTVYINLARADIARQTQCLLGNATLTTALGQQSYNTNTLTPVLAGLLTPLNIRSMRTIGSNNLSKRMEARSWEWFSNYYLDGMNSIAVAAMPTLWAQQVQGANGVIWIWPTPNAAGAHVIADATWLPIDLVDDSTAEAIPPPWTDVVPYFAAYMGLVQAQRLQDAQGLYALYGKFAQSARLGVTPPWQSFNYPTLTPLPTPIDPSATMAGQVGKPAQKAEGNL